MVVLLGVLVRIFGTICKLLFRSTLKTAMFNLACIFSLKGSSSSGQPLAVDSSLSLSRGGCEAPKEPVGATFHPEEEEEEGGIKQDVCQGGITGDCTCTCTM